MKTFWNLDSIPLPRLNPLLPALLLGISGTLMHEARAIPPVVDLIIGLGQLPIFDPQPSGILIPPVQLSYSEDKFSFSLTLVGGDFDTDSAMTFGLTGDYWKGSFSISQDAGYFHDILTLGGSFSHVVSPGQHDDRPFGEPFVWTLVADADDAIGPPYNVHRTASGDKDHPYLGHMDTYNAILNAAVTSSVGLDDITTWTFELNGRHPKMDSPLDFDPELPPAIPEPCTVYAGLLLAAGCAIHLLRRRAGAIRREVGSPTS